LSIRVDCFFGRSSGRKMIGLSRRLGGWNQDLAPPGLPSRIADVATQGDQHQLSPLSAALGLLLLAAVAVTYVLIAWSTEPGFFDGLAPQQPYHWVSPPPQSAPFNQQPAAAHQAVTTEPGVQTLGVGTLDRQAQLLFGPEVFGGAGPLVVDVEPVARFPHISGFQPSTNVYLIRASAPLAKPAQVRLMFSELARTGRLYRAAYPDGPWQPVGAPDPQGLSYFVGDTSALPAYFVGGSPVTPTRSRDALNLQLVAAVAVAVVLLAAVPLLLLRRRSAKAGEKGP
jgi:hypothetical protein